MAYIEYCDIFRQLFKRLLLRCNMMGRCNKVHESHQNIPSSMKD